MDLGPVEIVLVLVVVLLLFGGTRIAEVGGSLGKGIREFRNAIKDDSEDAPASNDLGSRDASVRCPSCGAANETFARYCAGCGNPITG